MKRRRAKTGPLRVGAVLAGERSDAGLGRLGPVAPHVWQAAVGPRVAARTRPVRLERGVLTVRVASPVWSQELGFLAPTIAARLVERGVEVARLRFVVGPVEAVAREPRPGPVRVIRAPRPLPPSVLAAIEAVDDPELRAAITEAARSNLAWQEERTRPLPVVEGTRAARGLRVPPPKLRG